MGAEVRVEENATEHHGIRDMDVLNERSRCKGQLEGGDRCLRRAVDGTPYCREHALGFQIGSPVSGTPLVLEPTLDEVGSVDDPVIEGGEKTLDDVPVFREEGGG